MRLVKTFDNEFRDEETETVFEFMHNEDVPIQEAEHLIQEFKEQVIGRLLEQYFYKRRHLLPKMGRVEPPE